VTVDQISVFVENKPGKLVEVVELLGAKGIDLRAMSIADTADFGILRLIVDKPQKALEELRAAEFVTTVNKVLPVLIDDKPGALARVIRVFSDAGISIEYVYAFVTHEANKASVIFRVEDNGKAIEVLKANGVELADESKIFG
jgi:hypothetical protein